MRTPAFLSSFLLGAAAFASMGATDCGQIIDDSGFDLWCGPTLCDWQVDFGEIRMAPTWHEDDSGVELIGSEVRIGQMTEVNDTDGHCIRFEMIADLDEGVDLRFQMDVWGDTTYELDERVPSGNWRPVSYTVRMPFHYDGVRFRLFKRNAGRAVLANISAAVAPEHECSGPPLEVDPPAVAPPAMRSPATWSPVAADGR